MCAFQRGNDALETREKVEGLHGLFVYCIRILDAARIMVERMLRSHGSVIEASGHGMGQFYLPLCILEDECLCTLEYAERAAGEPGSVLSALDAKSPSFDTIHFNGRIVEKLKEQTHGIRTAANTGDHGFRKLPLELQDLFLCLASDNRLKISNHHGERMRAENRAKHVMGIRYVRDPVTHGLVYRVFKRFAAKVYSTHRRAKKFHSKNV